MQTVLNFNEREKLKVLDFLKKYTSKPLTSVHEEFRCEIGSCTVTLYKSGKLLIQGEKHVDVKYLLLDAIKLEDSFILGIDETGRGEPLGPFVISGILGKTNSLRELRDSKRIAKIKEKADVVTKKSLAQAIISLNSEYVDSLRERGFNLNQIEIHAINTFAEFFEKFEKELPIKVDGDPLKNAKPRIEFIPKGDDLEPVIGAASVLAKHFRNESQDKSRRKTWNQNI